MISGEAKKVVEDAKKAGMWIYDPSYRQWYSPEAFAHIQNYVNGDENYFKQLQIKHPREGIEAGFKQLSELEKRLHAFVLRVNEYYESKRDRSGVKEK